MPAANASPRGQRLAIVVKRRSGGEKRKWLHPSVRKVRLIRRMKVWQRNDSRLSLRYSDICQMNRAVIMTDIPGLDTAAMAMTSLCLNIVLMKLLAKHNLVTTEEFAQAIDGATLMIEEMSPDVGPRQNIHCMLKDILAMVEGRREPPPPPDETTL